MDKEPAFPALSSSKMGTLLSTRPLRSASSGKEIFVTSWETYEKLFKNDHLEHRLLYGVVADFLQTFIRNTELSILDLGKFFSYIEVVLQFHTHNFDILRTFITRTLLCLKALVLVQVAEMPIFWLIV
jgi:hypothetical protein